MKKAKPREIDKQLGLVLARGGAEVGNGERVVRSEGRQELIKSTTTTTTTKMHAVLSKEEGISLGRACKMWSLNGEEEAGILRKDKQEKALCGGALLGARGPPSGH